MNKERKKVMKKSVSSYLNSFAEIAIILIVFILLVVAVIYLANEPKPVERPSYSEDGPEMQKTKKLMKKHGIVVSVCENDECYFYRENIKCQLK